jgi:hypothetical protein
VVCSFTASKPQDVLEEIAEYNTSNGNSVWNALPRMRNELDAARTARIPIVFMKGDPDYKAICGALVKNGMPSGPGSSIRRQSPTKSRRVTKNSSSARPRQAHCFRPLATYLIRHGVDSLIVKTTTSGCVRATVVDGFSHATLFLWCPMAALIAAFSRRESLRHEHKMRDSGHRCRDARLLPWFRTQGSRVT